MQLPTWNAPTSLTPEAIERRRRLAEALMTQGMDYSPVQSWTQGAARLASALAGSSQMARADKADATLKREADLKAATEKAKAEAEKRNTPDWKMADEGWYNANPYMAPATGPKMVQERPMTAYQRETLKAKQMGERTRARQKTKGRDGREYYLDTGESVFPEGHPANVASTGGIPNSVRAKTFEMDSSLNALYKSLDEYSKLVGGYKNPDGTYTPGSGYARFGDERDAVQTARRNIQMQMKDIFGLGALQAPDERVLNEMLVDPTASLSAIPFDGEKGALGMGVDMIGEGFGMGTGIKHRVQNNVEQLKKQFKSIVDERKKVVGMSELPPGMELDGPALKPSADGFNTFEEMAPHLQEGTKFTDTQTGKKYIMQNGKPVEIGA
jgi:hypothetical protein